MVDKRTLIRHWIARGVIAPERVDRALAVAETLPSPRAWRDFIDRLLLFGGMGALACAMIFFFAYNWDAMGRLAKFALVQVGIVATLVGYWRVGPEALTGRALLLLAALLTGALLALYGQVYQTGADPWQLFAIWALLILPWVIIGRLAALWVLWIALLNVALGLYFSTFGGLWRSVWSTQGQLLLALVLNTVAWALWERGAMHYAWLAERWAVRLLALASGVLATLLMVMGIVDSDGSWIPVVYLLWLAGVYVVYRYRVPDLFMLAGGCLSVVVVVTTWLADRFLGLTDAGGYLVVALAVIGLSAAAAHWLKRVKAEMAS